MKSTSSENILKNCKGILLDLDHTLYDYHKCHNQSIRSVFQYVSQKFSLPEEEVEKVFESAKKKVNTNLLNTASSHNRMLYFQVMYESLGIHPLAHTLDVYNKYWDTFISMMDFDEGVQELLLKWSKQKKICLITDLTVHIQHRKIQKLKLYECVHHIVSSEEAGREKPHPFMFELSLNKLRLTNSQVCMIGDNYKKDIVGAMNMNIYSFWLNRDNEESMPHKLITEVKSFKELEQYG
jgi:HAD superfamily hydrolase (TIGR01549 family)